MYSPIEHIARSLWLGSFDWRNRMAMYSAYFDESGHPDSGEYLVVAGCIADVDQWVHLEREWTEALAPHGIDIFHMVDFQARNRPFDTLSERDADDLLMRLVGIIVRRAEKSISQVLRLDDYNAMNEIYVFAESYGYPYPMLGRGCIGHVQTWAQKYNIPETNLRYFFENGAKHKGQLEWIAERDHLRIPVFLEKREFVVLQAADLVAWCHYYYLTTHGKPEARYEKAIDKLAELSNEWGLINLGDPHRIPSIVNIPVRDPNMRYKSVILRKDGRRRAVTHYWPKTKATEPKVNRKTLVLPAPPPLTFEQVQASAKRYDLLRSSGVQK